MGLRSSPYNAIQGILFAEEVVKGNSLDVNNIFRWDEVQLNLPGDPNYKPWLPWVCKIRLSDGKVACDFVIYVDDVRSCGNSWAEARLASRSIASRMNWLGLQDAARKRRDPCQDPGPWAGLVIHTNHGAVTVSVTQDRWTKAVDIISWIAESIKHSADIEFKKLESYRGYLVYLSRTYPILTPYLKGIHLTLDSWRPWRKSDGWKLTLSEIRLALEEKGQETGTCAGSGEKAPSRVGWVPRLKDDIRALEMFMSSETPPKRLVRPKGGATAVFAVLGVQ